MATQMASSSAAASATDTCAVARSLSSESKKRKRTQWGLRDVTCMNIIKVIGDGTYGMVLSASDKVTGEAFALKKIKMEKENQGFPLTAIREIKILKALHHENIVKLKEIVTYEPKSDETDPSLASMKIVGGDVFMVLEYTEYDLAGLLSSRQVTFTEDHVKCYAKQLLEGINFMHRNRILHRDIKGANILVTADNRVKIADLGLARSYISTDEKFTSNNTVVTRWYRCPELLLDARKYGPEIDIWSIGCLFAELKERAAIMQGRTDPHQLELIYQLCGTPVPPPAGAAAAGAAAVSTGKQHGASASAASSSNSSCGSNSAISNSTNSSNHHTSLLDGTVYNLYREFPGWEKNKITVIYPPNLNNKFSKFSPEALDLLKQMLHMHPKQRISAASALNHDYFWTSEFPTPQELPKFVNISYGHEFEAKERYKAEEARRQREMAQYVARQSQHMQPHYPHPQQGRAHQQHQHQHQQHQHQHPNYHNRQGQGGHPGGGKRSSQGLTRGFTLLPK